MFVRKMWIPRVSKIDFDRLLKQFKASDSVRFEQFCEVWKSLKMSYIMSGIEAAFEMRQFIEDCMKVALDYCSPENEFQDRIGGLYILYALYYKQPLDPPARIRVMANQWNDLKMLLQEMKGQQHLDAEYIFTRLRTDQAFQLVATSDRKMFIKPKQGKFTENDRQATEKMASHDQEPSIISDIMEPDAIGQLSALHEQYHQMKCYLSGKGSSTPDEPLSCIKNNLVQNITKSVASFEEYRKQRLDPRKVRVRRRKDSGTTTTSESEADSDFEAWRPKKKKMSKHGDLRASLKQKAFSMPVGSRYSILRQRRDLSPENQTNVSDSGADESDVLLSPVGKQSDTVSEDEYVPGQSPKQAHIKRKSRKKSPAAMKETLAAEDTNSPRKGVGRGARVRGAGIRTRGRMRRQ